MKVTMVWRDDADPVPPVLGGSVAHTLYETAMAFQNPEFTVISRLPDVTKVDIETSDKFYHVDIDAEASCFKALVGEHIPPKLKSLKIANQFFYLNGVTDLLKKIDPDIIQVHCRLNYMSYLSKQFSEKKFILYMHAEPPKSHWNAKFQSSLEHIDHLVFVSEYLAKRFVSRYPLGAHKTTVIYNSVDTKTWHPKLKLSKKTKQIQCDLDLSPGQTVLFAGRILPEKGLACLLEAFNLVRHILPHIKLIVLGSPALGQIASSPFMDQMKWMASQMGHSVHFMGYVAPHRAAHYFAASDVTVVPSLCQEGFGKVIIESMAVGVPVIASRRGGIPEIIEDGVNGILVDDPEDVFALAEEIFGLLLDTVRRKKMGLSARKKVTTSFSKSIRMARVRAFYKMIEKGGHKL